MSALIEIETWRSPGGIGADGDYPTAAYRVQSYFHAPARNNRIIRVERGDYDGYTSTVLVEQNARGDVMLTRSDDYRAPWVVHPDDVDKLILSLLEVRRR